MDKLYRLIHSLDKTEKRYFTRYSTSNRSDSRLLKLFDIISKQTKYSEQALQKKYNKLTTAFLYNVDKNRLYDAILKCMRIYNADKGPENEVIGLIQEINFLLEKSLLAEAAKKLNKAKTIAQLNDLGPYLLELNKTDYILRAAYFYAETTDKELKILSDNNEKTLEEIREITQLRKLEGILFHAYYTTDPKKLIIEDLEERVMKPILHNEKKIITTKGLIYCNNIKAQYYKITGDLEQSYIYRKNMLNYITGLKHKTRKMLLNHISAINNLVQDAIKLNKLNEAELLINSLRDLPNSYPKKLVSDNAKIKIFSRLYLLELMLLSAAGDITRGLKIINEIENKLTEYGSKIPPFPLLHLYSKLAGYCFENHYHEDTLHWVNKALNHKHIKRLNIIYYQCSMLNLLTRFDLDQIQLLEHLMRSTKRSLQNIDRFEETEKEVFQYLNTQYKLKSKVKKADVNLAYYTKWNNKAFIGDINLSKWIAEKVTARALG